MNRNSSDFTNPALASSRYASPFRHLSPKKKSRESATSSSSVSSRKKRAPIFLKTRLPPSMDLMKALRQLRGPRSPRSRHQSSLSSTETETTESSEQSTPNVMEFLIDVCPEDILPKILAFAGPQKTSALSKVNRVWRDVIDEDWTWRALCEDLYKWTPDQQEPASWKDYYMKNPVVPTDYPSIHTALAVVTNGSKRKPRQCGDVRILVRPGRYFMPKIVTVHAIRRTVQITVEAMRLPEPFMLGRVCLLSQTRLPNEPIFRVTRGKLVLKDLYLEHKSIGVNIWMGNAAVQVQPDSCETSHPLSAAVAKASAVLESVEVMSHSGRGIVALDGGHVQIKDSYIHDCAATGVFVGGNGSRADLKRVDVSENGTGNLFLGGITRGHSGIYIDKGVVSITDSNVSRNLGSGIFIVMPDQTELTLVKTDILANINGPIHTCVGATDRVVVDRDCHLAFVGSYSPRSTILVAECADDDSEADLIDF